MQDYRALKTLEKKIGREEVEKLLYAEGFEKNFTVYPKDAAWHIAFREKRHPIVLKMIYTLRATVLERSYELTNEGGDDVTVENFDKNKPGNPDSLKVPLIVAVKFRGSVTDVEAAVEAAK